MTLIKNVKAEQTKFHNSTIDLGPPITEDFKSFKITPLINDNKDGWEDATYFPGSPGRAVCSSEALFRWEYNRIKQSQVYKELCASEGPNFIDVLIYVGSGFLAGYAVSRFLPSR